MLRSFFFLATLLCANSFAYAQTVLQGRVVDDRTLEPLAFVHIAVVGAQQGAQSDIDGLFSISVYGIPCFALIKTCAGPQTQLRVKFKNHTLVKGS